MFEDKDLADQAVMAVEKRIHHGDKDIMEDTPKEAVMIQKENVETVA